MQSCRARAELSKTPLFFIWGWFPAEVEWLEVSQSKIWPTYGPLAGLLLTVFPLSRFWYPPRISQRQDLNPLVTQIEGVSEGVCSNFKVVTWSEGPNLANCGYYKRDMSHIGPEIGQNVQTLPKRRAHERSLRRAEWPAAVKRGRERFTGGRPWLSNKTPVLMYPCS